VENRQVEGDTTSAAPTETFDHYEQPAAEKRSLDDVMNDIKI
jgi:hypothetical protein